MSTVEEVFVRISRDLEAHAEARKKKVRQAVERGVREAGEEFVRILRTSGSGLPYAKNAPERRKSGRMIRSADAGWKTIKASDDFGEYVIGWPDDKIERYFDFQNSGTRKIRAMNALISAEQVLRNQVGKELS